MTLSIQQAKFEKGSVSMLNFLKKSIWIPYEDSTVFPTAEKAQQAIVAYCNENGYSCTFTGDDSVIIDGVEHEIYRGLQPGSRGNYGIKCREK